MFFTESKSLGSVVREFQIVYREADFVVEVPLEVSQHFREDLQLVMQDGVVDNSEFAICENLIYPVLKEVWKNYRHHFLLWSHQSLNYSDRLSGFPEYILAKRSPLGKVVFDRPYFILVEAKQDKFDEGWGQCLAEMVAAKRLNEQEEITVFGIVSNGKIWQFGKIRDRDFKCNITFYSIQDLDSLFASVNYIFQQCDQQVNNPTTV